MMSYSESEPLFFAMYRDMERPRSLTRLHGRLSAMGSPISFGTLSRMSADHKWGQRVKDDALNDSGHEAFARLWRYSESFDRRSTLAKGLTAAAAAGLQALVANPARLQQLTAREVSQLAVAATRVDPDSGKIGELHDWFIAFLAFLWPQLLECFNQVNEIPDAEMRRTTFYDLAQPILETVTKYTEAFKKTGMTGEGMELP